MSIENATSFGESMRCIRQCPWYWGNLSWMEAELLLKGAQPGTYLIRDSASDTCIFTLTYRTESSVHHTRLVQHGGIFCLGGPNSLVKASSLVKFVEEALKECGERGICMLMHAKYDRSLIRNVTLRHPLKRHDFLPSLQYLCRLSIRHSFSLTYLCTLRLPTHIRSYIEDNRYILPPFVHQLVKGRSRTK